MNYVDVLINVGLIVGSVIALAGLICGLAWWTTNLEFGDTWIPGFILAVSSIIVGTFALTTIIWRAGEGFYG